MFDDSRAFISRAFLRSFFELEYRIYQSEGADAKLLARLNEWNERLKLSETQAEGAFIQTFFVDTWGYGESGRVDEADHTIIPKLRILGEGAGGGTGEADLALGWFRGRADATPQVLCEFKDIRSKLDAKQSRKGGNRSPVEQCLNYVRGARRNLFGNEPVQPWWGLVTDMNEFRLYWWDRAPSEYLRFVIRRDGDLFAGDYDLLSVREEAEFDRFLFWKLFQRNFLISHAGRPPLLRLIEKQWVREDALEEEFYDRYRATRERLYNVLRLNNQEFPGTETQLLRLSQKLMDRFIFAFYCEDMGERMLFPPQFVREYLQTRSKEPYYETDGTEIWEFFKRLFKKMNTGGPFGKQNVPFINGGLFADDPLIDGLHIPNHVFAAAGQGVNEASLESDNNTLLYLSARYNYAARGRAEDSISLYTLGRIFEQSITELEYRVGEIEGRDTVAKLSKRKRDGVYYTPEWVVNYLVEETMGPWFSNAREACGFPGTADDARPNQAAVEKYIAKLKSIRIVDPACGSGAFLISAFRRLLEERLSADRLLTAASSNGVKAAPNEAVLIAEILADNIYGVDINPAAVEIARLALWLHSARADAPLSSLDRTIRCGNSLVTHDFWQIYEDTPERREIINSFDWREAFPEIWADDNNGGFDIVLGNPPYVKLQNMKKAYPDVADYLQTKRGADTYASTQTGNFDLYLPFIEKGLRLLGPGGRMAYIAPNLWPGNNYGEGLRQIMLRTRQLERWADFKSYQVFDDVTVYTALQFFTKEPQSAVQIALAPDGDAADVDWADPETVVPYAAFPEDSEWVMATGAEKALIDRLARDCLRLDDPKMTKGITVGIQTSADYIYHLRRVGDERYVCTPKGKPEFEVAIEDAIMKPLVSGPEAKRYETPEADTYLLFPYARDDKDKMRLIPAAVMENRYPMAWKYLRSWEKELRAREKSRFDDDEWHRFGRNQNIDKQDINKLIVAQTVPSLRLCADDHADKYLNNVRVNGILPAKGVDMFYLLGVLNSSIADFVFKRIGKPKRGGWYEANRQFIAPLPVPDAAPEDRADIAARARDLQERWTRRRALLHAAEERLSTLARAKHKAHWLWPALPALPDMMEQAPKALKLKTDRRAWADEQIDALEAQSTDALQAALDGRGALQAEFKDGELTLFAGGSAVLDKIYLDGNAGRLAEAYWRFIIMKGPPRDAGKFAKDLMRPPADSDSPAARQFIDRVDALAAESSAIDAAEHEMNERLYDLYGLSSEERLLVDNDDLNR